MNDTAHVSADEEGTASALPGVSADSIESAAAKPIGTNDPDVPGQRAFRERRRSRMPWVLLSAAFAFLIGIAVAFFAYPHIVSLWGSTDKASTGAAQGDAASSANQKGSLPINAARQDLLAVRLAELEDRLARISIAAQTASGNATRAEGLLVAFAARRALDSGAPLGYVEGQLRQRFGQAQPRAVATIINAAREPVTLIDLQGGFAELAPSLSHSPPGTGWWTALRQEMRNLVIIRKTATPSPLPERTIPRIERLLAAGRIAPAMEEVERLPGKAKAERWLDMARRYREARRALDLIETAAILENPPAIGLAPAPAVTDVSPPSSPVSDATPPIE